MVLPVRLSELAAICGAEKIIGDTEVSVTGFCSVASPDPYSLTFVSAKNFLKFIDNTSEAIYIVKSEWADEVSSGLIHDNPTQAYRMILDAFFTPRCPAHIADTARIDASAKIGANVSIGDFSVIEAGVVIGDNCMIGNQSTIGQSAVIGANTRIDHRVTIHHECQLGEHCVVADGVVIGGQGFGFSFEGGQWKAIPQIGRVVIGNEVHIGNNTCIDRGAINDTVIGNNVIIDNLVHIAHNVKIGSHSALAGAVGIAGSTTIGEYCMFGGHVGIAGHIEICDGVQVNGGANILQSIKTPGTYAGALNVMPSTKWNRTAIYFKKIEQLFRREKKQ